jgi:hypothetical protein
MNNPILQQSHDGDALRAPSKPYITTELDIASFLVASGHRLLDAQPQGALVQFVSIPAWPEPWRSTSREPRCQCRKYSKPIATFAQ